MRRLTVPVVLLFLAGFVAGCGNEKPVVDEKQKEEVKMNMGKYENPPKKK